MKDIWREINGAIHRRETGRASELISSYLKLNKKSVESLYEASEFYRKMTDYKSALRILPKERKQTSLERLSEKEVKLELQRARILNLLGASRYALRTVHQLQLANKLKSKIEVAEIFHCNYLYSSVVQLIGENYPVPDSEPWHQDWLLHFYLSYAQAELGNTDAEIKRMEKIREISRSPLIKVMSFYWQGRYLVKQDEARLALVLIERAKGFFTSDDQTADHAIFQMFLGECLLQLGDYAQAETALKKALKTFFLPSVKPEDWIEIALMLEKIPGYRTTHQLAPRLLAIYGRDYPPLKLAEKTDLQNGDLFFSISTIECSKKTTHLDRAADTAWEKGKARLGLDLIDELICNLVYAGEYGLPQFRVYELLWPDELFSFTQHQKRLENLVVRARAQGYDILWKDMNLRLLSKDVTVSGRPEKVIRGHSFLMENASFTRSDVERYFSISSASAKVLCRNWLSSKLVVLGPSSRYLSTLM